jgi:hypothetical protein
MRLKDPARPPQLFYTVSLGGKALRIPKRGYVHSVDRLVSEVRTVYSNNLDPVPADLADRIIDQICSRNPNRCWPSKNPVSYAQSVPIIQEKPPQTSRLTLNDALVGSRALWENATGQTVDQPTVQARASVCSRGNNGKPCPYLVSTEELAKAEASCQSCGGKSKVISTTNAVKNGAKSIFSTFGIKSEVTIPPTVENKACAVCSCLMENLIPVLPDTLRTKQDDLQRDQKRPEYCWARQYIKRPTEAPEA